jgi:intracellular sulfur oxidation DsrE/DsrF family protein
MKRTAVALLALLIVAIAAISQTPKPHKHHVVIENTLATPQSWGRVLTHVGVLQKAFPDDVDIEVVNLGEGLAMLNKADAGLEASIKRYADSGVIFAACQNSMRARNVTTEDLFPFAKQVPAGVAEIVMKQEAGYAYLKPID